MVLQSEHSFKLYSRFKYETQTLGQDLLRPWIIRKKKIRIRPAALPFEQAIDTWNKATTTVNVIFFQKKYIYYSPIISIYLN